MKKRLLICFWGRVSECISQVKENFNKIFHSYEIDYLISTWSTENLILSDFDYVIASKSPSKEDLDSMRFPYCRQIKNVPEWHVMRFGHYAQFYHNFNIVNFLKQNKIKYDFLARTRTDVFFETSFNFEDNINSECCFLPEIYWNSKGVGINENFIIGKFDYVMKSLNIENFESFFPVVEQSWNPETMHQSLILLNDCRYSEFSCDTYTLLPTRKFK
jgi:hypothetical protein